MSLIRPFRCKFPSFNSFNKFHSTISQRRLLPDHSKISYVIRKTSDISSKTHNPIVFMVRHMAGHAKWQNVKHVKAEKDRQKNLLCNKFVHLVGYAVREGGPDPKLNHKLAVLMEQAKKNNVPSSTIEGILKKDAKKTKFGSMEILGPGGSLIIVEYITANIPTIRFEIKSLCRKYGAANLSGEGRWRAAYEQKGVVTVVGRKDGQPLDPESAEDDAILAGAEEVQAKQDQHGMVLEFVCPPDDLNPMKGSLEKTYDVEEGYVAYVPLRRLSLAKEDADALEGLLDDLGSLGDVVRVFENVTE